MTTQVQKTPLILPFLAPLYDAIAPLTLLWMRLICGFALMMHGWPKITNPLGATEMVANIGFAPAWLWSIALSVTEFGGGLLLFVGLLTRFAAAGVSVILFTTVIFHWVILEQGYKGAELSLIWMSITLYFVAHGGGRLSLDRVLNREL